MYKLLIEYYCDLQVNYTLGYEPYFFARKSDFPPYDESFLGRGGNKWVQILDMWANGYVDVSVIYLQFHVFMCDCN